MEPVEKRRSAPTIERWIETQYQAIVIAIAALSFLLGVLSPPSLMDDVDSVHAAIARTMLQSGDWVTARLDGLVYLDKAPLTTWLAALSYAVFGVHDWAARAPIALSAIALCWVTARFGAWALSKKAGLWAGVAVGTCVGLFLFTRILIPEVILTLVITLALWAFLRLLEAGDNEEKNRGRWILVLGISLGAGLLLKGLLGIVAPAGAIFLYLLLTRQLFSRQAWRRSRPFASIGIALAIAAPWYVAATIANPPYFDFTLHSEPGHFRGFFWRYFINEHLLRYLGLRYPHDYSTVPRLPFWLLHLVWLFPWSVYLPAAARLSFQPRDRAGRVRLLAICWSLFLLVFFTFSTTQEYYTMPIYPALALLIASAMTGGAKTEAWVRRGTLIASAVAGLAGVVALVIYFLVWSAPTTGDIARALTNNPDAYTLSLGHFSDLTLGAFAYLRWPLLIAGLVFLAGAAGAWKFRDERGWLSLALMMVVFTQAARMALVVFDPYLSSRPLAEALVASPPGQLMVDGEYYPFSSVFFYANRSALLIDGRGNNLEYGSYAPGAPDVFIDKHAAAQMWNGSERCYLLAQIAELPRLQQLLGAESIHVVKESGGKALLSNQPVLAAGSP